MSYVYNECNECGEIYTDVFPKWCKSCQINNFKNNFTNWTSGNEVIDSYIQEMQLKIDKKSDIVFEWIPYNQLSSIEEISNGDFAIVYSAIWNDGPLYYYDYKKECTRQSNKKVALKCIHNSQNIINEILNEV